MKERKFSLGLPLAIAMSVILATSASVDSVLAAGYVTPAGGAAGNTTKAGNATAGGAAGNTTKAGNATAGGAAGNTTKAGNATAGNTSSSSNPLASIGSKIGKALSGIFGGKK